MAKHPKVTVLMPVYNGEKYLREAIDSILQQTFTDFEFLIINDGSTDSSVEIIGSYVDPRIRLVHNEKNLKLIATLNKGLELAHSEYIARMDCDDISLPDRLARQVAFMDLNPEVGICGTWAKTISNSGSETWRYPTSHDAISCSLLFSSVFVHPSVIMRKTLIEKFKLRYDNNYPHAEDFQLWQRASRLFKLANIGKSLVLYRITSQSVSRSNRDIQRESLKRIDSEFIAYIGICPNNSDLDIHRRLAFFEFESSRKFVSVAETWLIRLWDANKKTNVYPSCIFEQILADKWFEVCRYSMLRSTWIWKTFLESPLVKIALPNLLNIKKFKIK